VSEHIVVIMWLDHPQTLQFLTPLH